MSEVDRHHDRAHDQSHEGPHDQPQGWPYDQPHGWLNEHPSDKDQEHDFHHEYKKFVSNCDFRAVSHPCNIFRWWPVSIEDPCCVADMLVVQFLLNIFMFNCVTVSICTDIESRTEETVPVSENGIWWPWKSIDSLTHHPLNTNHTQGSVCVPTVSKFMKKIMTGDSITANYCKTVDNFQQGFDLWLLDQSCPCTIISVIMPPPSFLP